MSFSDKINDIKADVADKAKEAGEALKHAADQASDKIEEAKDDVTGKVQEFVGRHNDKDDEPHHDEPAGPTV